MVSFYQGTLTLTVSTWLHPLIVHSSWSGIHRVVVYMGLYLIAIGSGGIKPCISALGADQFDGADRPGGASEQGLVLELVPLLHQPGFAAVVDGACLGAGQHWVGSRVRHPDGVRGVGPRRVCRG
jgi:hypothetical protein